jgi:hypothetical protein
VASRTQVVGTFKRSATSAAVRSRAEQRAGMIAAGRVMGYFAILVGLPRPFLGRCPVAASRAEEVVDRTLGELLEFTLKLGQPLPERPLLAVARRAPSLGGVAFPPKRLLGSRQFPPSRLGVAFGVVLARLACRGDLGRLALRRRRGLLGAFEFGGEPIGVSQGLKRGDERGALAAVAPVRLGEQRQLVWAKLEDDPTAKEAVGAVRRVLSRIVCACASHAGMLHMSMAVCR